MKRRNFITAVLFSTMLVQLTPNSILAQQETDSTNQSVEQEVVDNVVTDETAEQELTPPVVEEPTVESSVTQEEVPVVDPTTPSSEQITPDSSTSETPIDKDKETSPSVEDSGNKPVTPETSVPKEEESSSSTEESTSEETSESSTEETTDSSTKPPKEEEDKDKDKEKPEKGLSDKDKEKYNNSLEKDLTDLPKDSLAEYKKQLSEAKTKEEAEKIIKEAKAYELELVRNTSLDTLYGLSSLSQEQLDNYRNLINNSSNKNDIKLYLSGAKDANEKASKRDESTYNITPPSINYNTNSSLGGGVTSSGSVGVGSINYTRNLETSEFIKTIALQAHEDGQKNDLYASITIAQAILESGSGNSSLSKSPYFNLFGIKGSYKGQSVSMGTQEDNGSGSLYSISSAFRAYPSFKESIEDHSDLFLNGIQGNKDFYKGTWKSVSKTTQEVSKFLTGKYATDTSYNAKLDGLIKTYNLERFDKKELTKEDKEYIESFDINDVIVSTATSQSVGTYSQAVPSQFKEFLPKNYKPSTGQTQLGNAYPINECTWFAFNRVKENGGKIEWFSGNSGHGGFWAQTAKSRGYEVNKEAKAGKMVVFTPGVHGYHAQYGHVAYVEAVDNNGNVLISESGQGLPLTGTFKTITKEQAKDLLYVTPK